MVNWKKYVDGEIYIPDYLTPEKPEKKEKPENLPWYFKSLGDWIKKQQKHVTTKLKSRLEKEQLKTSDHNGVSFDFAGMYDNSLDPDSPYSCGKPRESKNDEKRILRRIGIL